MLRIMLLGLAATSFIPQTDDAAIAVDRTIYEAARTKAGQQPAALVKLSHWCQEHGLYSERGKLLLEAISIEPGNAAARGLLGLISYRGQWLSPEYVRAILSDFGSEVQVLKDLPISRLRLPESPWAPQSVVFGGIQITERPAEERCLGGGSSTARPAGCWRS